MFTKAAGGRGSGSGRPLVEPRGYACNSRLLFALAMEHMHVLVASNLGCHNLGKVAAQKASMEEPASLVRPCKQAGC